jgi:DNA helicase-2/ATP-dependent DNA helicase PcrA
MNYLDELNPAQRAAVECINGPVMIIAGAGSGKTRVLTYRIAHMVNREVDSFNILALTFTNKAAQEMKERIQHIAGSEARNLWMGTFHSVFARILRIEADKIGYPTNFTIYDTDDAKSLLKNIIKENNLNDTIYKPNFVLNRISSAKNSLISWQQYQLSLELTTEDRMSQKPMLGKLYELYAKRCFQSGAMDFDDLLMKMHELLERSPEALAKYQRKFKYILIDEFQDTNFAQYEIIKKLAAVNENICVVGDDAQSIYSFRGATIANILNFEKEYPDLNIFKLEQNYRSTQHIVKAANEVISNNRAQLPKEIWTENQHGEKIKVVQTATDNDEGRWVADQIFENKIALESKDEEIITLRNNSKVSRFQELDTKMKSTLDELNLVSDRYARLKIASHE